MRRFFFLLAIAPFAMQAQPAPAPDARDLLVRSGGPLLTANMVRLSGTKKVEIDAPGVPQAVEDDTFTIAFTKDGRARWESTFPHPRLRVWDGTNEWEYSPASKTYSKNPATSAPENEYMTALKYGRTDILSATFEREERLELGGKPTPCYVVHAEYSAATKSPTSKNKTRTVWISRVNNLVLRDIWEYELPLANVMAKGRQTLSYSAIEWSDKVAEDVFVFTPPEGSKPRPVPLNSRPGARPATPPPGSGMDSAGGIGSSKGAPANPAKTPTGVREGVYRAGNGVTPPLVVSKVEPAYTEEARAAKFQGTVVLYVEVDPSGKATNVRVLRGLGLGLDEKAKEAVRSWVFKPGTKDGKPVTVMAQLEVNFHLE